MNPLLEHALAYAARGWPVFPVHSVRDGYCSCRRDDCTSPGKHPLTRNGKDDASLDPAQIEWWWQWWPWANVPIVTGSISEIAVLDIDGDRGRDSILDLQRRWGQLPTTLWARTARGWHCYLQHPGVKVPTSVDTLGPGLDVRGDGGYVVAPPSIHASGARYRWVDPKASPASMPRWLISALDPPKRVSPWTLVRGRNPGCERLEALVRHVASQPQGNRNAALFWAACRAVEEGHPPDEIAPLLLDAARACGLDDRESLRTIRSAFTRTNR